MTGLQAWLAATSFLVRRSPLDGADPVPVGHPIRPGTGPLGPGTGPGHGLRPTTAGLARRALTLNLVVCLLGFSVAATTVAIDPSATLPAVLGTALLTVGVSAGVEALVTTGIGGLAVAAVVAGNELDGPAEFAVLAGAGAVCATAVTAAMLSFTIRRSSRVETGPWRTAWGAAGGAIGLGTAAAAVAVGAASAVGWPAWILPIPLTIVTGLSAVVAYRVVRGAWRSGG